MKKIEAFKCDHCVKKVLTTRSGMRAHEKKCFMNPVSKSCIACLYFGEAWVLNGVKLTLTEEHILNHREKGTYTMQYDPDPESNGEEFPVLKEQYKYLYGAERLNHCGAFREVLSKLRTNCDHYNEDLPF